MFFPTSHSMVFRIPTQFDSFVASPSHPGQPAALQRSPQRPWRGRLIVTGLRNSNRSATDYIQVSAVETDGDNRVELWPRDFVVQRLPNRPILRQMIQYVQQYAQPTCNFLPERLNPDFHEANRANFRTLSRQMNENHEVAIAYWGHTSELSQTGAGIVIYPASNSGAYLIGAIFHSTDFPDFIRHAASQQPPPLSIPASVPYQSQAMGPPSSSYNSHPSHHRQPHTGSPHQSHPSSPTEQPGSAGSYRPIVSRTPIPHGNPYPNMPIAPTSLSFSPPTSSSGDANVT
ncbi:hypothetical protein CC2G_013556 [Coprinopsis cinerea AmutBmut pab1-1]|nr:hypothetical protein CC2G_013556 [Coprinopsis cinerea AmutBmut pab1-1]